VDKEGKPVLVHILPIYPRHLGQKDAKKIWSISLWYALFDLKEWFTKEVSKSRG
jgi:hypothetical protein